MITLKIVDKDVNELIKFHSDISINKIEEFMETLEDMDLLNNEGKEVRNRLWELFIQEKEEKEEKEYIINLKKIKKIILREMMKYEMTEELKGEIIKEISEMGNKLK